VLFVQLDWDLDSHSYTGLREVSSHIIDQWISERDWNEAGLWDEIEALRKEQENIAKKLVEQQEALKNKMHKRVRQYPNKDIEIAGVR